MPVLVLEAPAPSGWRKLGGDRLDGGRPNLNSCGGAVLRKAGLGWGWCGWLPGVRGDRRVGGDWVFGPAGAGELVYDLFGVGDDGWGIDDDDAWEWDWGKVGVRGAMRPSEFLRVWMLLEREKGRMEKRDLKREEGALASGETWRAGGIGIVVDEGEAVAEVGPDVGNALSPALRLRKRNKGASHTHTPKKVAISAKPGPCCLWCAACLAS